MEVLTPRSLGEALEMKASRPEAVPIAGGTDLMVALNFGHQRPSLILDLTHVGELKGYSVTGDRVHLGAMTTFTEIVEAGHYGGLIEASRTVGSPQIRNRATVGGNLATASPAGDSIPVLYTYDADIVLGSVGGAERKLPLREFFTGPKRTALEPHELILGVTWKRRVGPSTFAKIGTRNAMVISIASICVALDPVDRRARIALGSVGPTVLRAEEAESILTEALAAAGFWEGMSRRLQQDVVEGVAVAAGKSARPIDDVRASARYRSHACRVLARRVVEWTLSTAPGGGVLA